MVKRITPYLETQLRLHPSMTPRDVVKLCYQAARGAEHLLADPERARMYLFRELESTEASADMPLVELISDAVARVNLAPWKAQGRSADELFELFSATASSCGEGEDLLPDYLAEAEAWVAASGTSVTLEAWREFMAWYRAQGCPAVHHSESYRAAERPAYRIVRRELLEASGLF